MALIFIVSLRVRVAIIPFRHRPIHARLHMYHVKQLCLLLIQPVTTQEPPKLPRTVGARGTGEEMETTGDRFKRATDNKAKGGFNPFKEEKNLTTQYQQYTMDAEDPDDTEDFGGADLSVEFLVQEELRQILATVPE